MMRKNKSPEEVAAERFEMISPLTLESMDRGRRIDLTKEIASNSGISERSIRRYLDAFRKEGFEGLKPKPPVVPDGTALSIPQGIVDVAIELRRESPTRSIRDIIKILELEERITPGSVARSTLQRRMQASGFGARQVRMYTKKGVAARRFSKEHRCDLWQGDIKYGPYLPIGKNKQMKQIYLIVWIDDSTRHIMSAGFYDNQRVEIVEDSLRKAIMQFGKPDKIFVDNGKQYRSEWLKKACAKLEIVLLTSKPYHPEGKGKVESFNRRINAFMSEAALSPANTVAEYNTLLNVWLEEYYHKSEHSSLDGLTPRTAFMTDKRPLEFVDWEKLRAAFLHTEEREVDKTGCINFKGDKYEVGIALIARKVEIFYDPTWTDEIEIHHKDYAPFMAKRLVIGTNCGVQTELPLSIQGIGFEAGSGSRMLDGLEKKHAEERARNPVATSFRDLNMEEDENV
jgi:transposase InsO family protein